MELYKEILLYLYKEGRFDLPAAQLVELTSYQALQKIKAVIEDDQLDDETCFHKIEHIIRILETIGSNGGNRHDFG